VVIGRVIKASSLSLHGGPSHQYKELRHLTSAPKEAPGCLDTKTNDEFNTVVKGKN
jgi:hypothetical protein